MDAMPRRRSPRWPSTSSGASAKSMDRLNQSATLSNAASMPPSIWMLAQPKSDGNHAVRQSGWRMYSLCVFSQPCSRKRQCSAIGMHAHIRGWCVRRALQMRHWSCRSLRCWSGRRSHRGPDLGRGPAALRRAAAIFATSDEHKLVGTMRPTLRVDTLCDDILKRNADAGGGGDDADVAIGMLRPDGRRRLVQLPHV